MTISMDILLDIFPYLNFQDWNVLLMTSSRLSQLVLLQLKTRSSIRMAQVIRIKMLDNNVRLYLPDNFLTKSTIKSCFFLSPDDIVSLSYEVYGGRIICPMNETGTGFFLPEGWRTMQFVVESREVPSRTITQVGQYQNSRPGSSCDTRPESPYDRTPRSPAPMSSSIIKWMFYAYDEAGKSCVVCIHPRFFVTFRHGTHLQLNLDDSLLIHKNDSDETYNVSVVQIYEMRDFILLKSEHAIVNKGPVLANPEESESYLLAGYGNIDQNLSFLSGIVHIENYYFRKSDGAQTENGPFLLGTCTSSPGDSGGACWGSRGLIGLSLGCTRMPSTSHFTAISDAAIFSPKNYLISSTFISVALQDEILKEKRKSTTQLPAKKKACHVADIKGCGAVEFTNENDYINVYADDNNKKDKI